MEPGFARSISRESRESRGSSDRERPRSRTPSQRVGSVELDTRSKVVSFRREAESPLPPSMSIGQGAERAYPRYRQELRQEKLLQRQAVALFSYRTETREQPHARYLKEAQSDRNKIHGTSPTPKYASPTRRDRQIHRLEGRVETQRMHTRESSSYLARKHQGVEQGNHQALEAGNPPVRYRSKERTTPTSIDMKADEITRTDTGDDTHDDRSYDRSYEVSFADSIREELGEIEELPRDKVSRKSKREAAVELEGPPTFSKFLRDVSVMEGRRVLLEVEVTGSRPMDVAWLRTVKISQIAGISGTSTEVTSANWKLLRSSQKTVANILVKY
ncbi:putative titin [Apostichopus japonicus]|uniref:Putative titin n=1 Tax=Stichopus japonicus TaxID=307972 RepID=A0A2G8JDZ7_STIJA|nr:putative titin [Apostichopus japonicus]